MDHRLTQYESAIEALIRYDSSELITNEEPAHAAALFKAFFAHSHKDVLIFCHNLSKAVFNDPKLVAAARDCIARGVSLKIVTENPPEESAFLSLISEYLGKRDVTLKVLNKDLLPMNFAVSDLKRYRYEDDKHKTKAMACMNAPKMAKTLADLFARIDRSSPTN